MYKRINEYDDVPCGGAFSGSTSLRQRGCRTPPRAATPHNPLQAGDTPAPISATAPSKPRCEMDVL